MQISVLGPVEASSRVGRYLWARASRGRLLAMLALRGTHGLGRSRCVEGLWGEGPPATAPKMVQLYVSLLRRRSETAVTGPRDPHARARLRAARRPRGAWTRPLRAAGAAGAAREALALWRGAALADVADEPFAAAEIRRLEALRLTALDLRSTPTSRRVPPRARRRARRARGR